MKKDKLRSCLFIALMSVVHQSVAENFYVGAGFSFIKTDTGFSNPTGTTHIDEEDSGLKLFAGFQLNNNIAVQFHYADLGEASITGNDGDRFDLDGATFEFFNDGSKISSEIESVGISLLLGMDATANINPYLKFGLQRWDLEVKVVSPTLANGTISDDDTEAFVGIGVDLKLAEKIKLKLEFERYGADDLDTNLFSANLVYNFIN